MPSQRCWPQKGHLEDLESSTTAGWHRLWRGNWWNLLHMAHHPGDHQFIMFLIYIWLYLYKISIFSAQDFSSRCTKLTARALSTAWALATSWRSVTRSSFSSKELLSRLGTPFRWALNLWPNFSNKVTNSLRSKTSPSITAGSLVLPAERGAVGLPLCQSAQL